MIKIDDELAYKIHGIISSESDNDSDDDREFDEEYHLLKPPPYNYELIKDKIIVISSQKTPSILNYWQNQSINIENNGKINKTETTENAIVDNFTVLQATNVQNHNNKANSKRDNLDLYGQASSSVSNSANCMVNIRVKSVDKISSRDKKTFRKSYAKSNDIRIIEKTKIGLNINTKEDLEKEFPSLDEVSKNNFRRKDKIIKEESITSTSIVSGKKKKQFKPLPIEINYSKDIPNVEYVKISKKNRNKEIKGTTINKINFNIPAVRNEINDNKRKIRKIPKQSGKILVTKNLIDKTNSIEDTTNQIKEAKNDNKTQIQGTEVLANDVGFQEIESTKLNFEDSIPLYREERESAMFNNMSNKIVATNLMDFEEESYINEITDKKIKGTSKLTQSISEMECINSFQAVTHNIKINKNNDSDDDREFDEEYHLLKPPPYNYELIKDKIIVISSQKTPSNLNYWQNQSINIENNGKINKTETTENAIVDNFTVIQATNVQNHNKKANSKRDNLDLYGQASSSLSNSANCMVNVRVKSVDKISSRDKKTFRKSYAKSNDIRIIEKTKIGLNINTKEDLEKEFPSLDEVSKNNFRRKDKIIKEESITSTSIVSGKKKKQFKPLPIEINYSKDIPNVEYVKISKKNRNKEIKGTTINKINFNIPAVRNEINDNKRKIRKIPKQSVKILVTKNLIDKTNSIEDTTNQIKEAKNDNKTQIQGTEVLANDVGFQEIESTKLNFEDSIPLYREERESAMFNNMSNKIVATNLMDFEEESYINEITDKKIKGTSKLTQSISEMECINSFQAVTHNIKINKNKIKTKKRHNENLANISNGQRMEKNLNQANDIQQNINPGKENSSINLELGPSVNDHRDVVEYENIFDPEFKNFLQNIDYEGTEITDLNSFTYEQLHLAHTAYLRKDAMENSSNNVENIKNTSPQKKKPTKKKKKVKQPTAKLRHCNKLYQQNKNDSIMVESKTNFFKNEYEEFNAMACSYDLIYNELIFINFVACMQEIQNMNTNVSIISSVNINFYLGMKSLTYISTRFANDRKNYAYISKRTHSTKINEKIKNTHWEFGSIILKAILLHVIPQLF